MSETVYVALGSNVGNRAAFLQEAVLSLMNTPGLRLLCVSPFVETEPVGGPPGQGKYLNAVAELECELSPRELLRRMQGIERDCGRTRGVPNGPRTLDLDLLLFGRTAIDEPGLTVPHPRMEDRTFVLGPLSHLVPDLVLPGCGRTVARRLAELEEEDGPGLDGSSEAVAP